MELDDELYAQITKHSDIGEHYFVEGKFRKALEEYKVPFGAFKSFGPGESLGIAVAACYCNSMGAHLEFSSPLGKQTTARMIFPASCLCEPDSLRAVTPVPPCGAYDLQNCIMAKGFDPLKG
jgi:hypothetical protein